MPKKKPHPLTKVRYYATLVAAVVAIFSFFALLFLVPFVYDPTISTLSAGFPDQPDTCLLSEVRVGLRLSECNWTSCSEGCTAPNTNCIQLRVNVSHVPFDEFHRSPGYYTDQIWVGHNVPLRINIQSCGYPPRVNCTQFLNKIKKRLPGAGLARPPQIFFDGDGASSQTVGRSARHVVMETSHDSQDHLLPPRALPSQERIGSSTSRLTPQDEQLSVLNVSFDISLLHHFNVDWDSMDLSWQQVRAILLTMPPELPTLLPCYPARTQPHLVITDFDHGRVLFSLILAAVVPVAAFLLSILLLCYCHGGWCKRNCPQLPIPSEETDRMKILPPDVIVSRSSGLNGKGDSSMYLANT